MIEDLMTLQAEEKNAEVERVKNELLSDEFNLLPHMAEEISHESGLLTHMETSIEMRRRYAELASILYQCESIFSDLFSGKTLEEIGKRRNLQPFRILESIRKDCHELVERCVVAELTDKFGSDE